MEAETRPQVRRLLLVDDEPDLRNTIARYLNKNGYVVTEAADGAQALEILESAKHPFLAIVTDNDMPRLTGLDLLRALPEKSIKIPIKILATGRILFEKDIQKLSTEYGTFLLRKPFDRADLLQALRDFESQLP